MEYVSCNLCKTENAKLLFPVKDINQRQEGIFSIVQCNSCGLVYLNPRPTKEEISKFYPNDYYISQDKQSKLSVPALGGAIGRFRKILKYKKGGKILDIGCKRGDYLVEFERHGWEIYGLELSSLAAQYAREKYGFDVITGDLLDTNLPDRKFDVVSLWGVLEHLRYPFETLEEVRRIIKDDGLLVIYVPNFDSFQARIFRDNWFHLDAPRHLFHFSPSTIKTLLKKTGFRIESITHFHFFPNYVGLRVSLLYLLKKYNVFSESTEKLKVDKVKFSLLRSIFNNFCKILSIIENISRHGGTITIYAYKT